MKLYLHQASIAITNEIWPHVIKYQWLRNIKTFMRLMDEMGPKAVGESRQVTLLEWLRGKPKEE